MVGQRRCRVHFLEALRPCGVFDVLPLAIVMGDDLIDYAESLVGGSLILEAWFLPLADGWYKVEAALEVGCR